MEDTIIKFLFTRKADWIKKQISAVTTDEQLFAIEHEAGITFSLENWLPAAAKRAAQLSLVSHPSKFSHPSSKTSSVIANCKRSADGFLRSGNAACKLDVVGNAAAMDVFKFLSLELSDGESILTHLERNTETIKNELKVASASFDEIRDQLLAIKKSDDYAVTNGRVKQVYFPVEDSYHLLSILTPSGLLFELRNRIQNLRFSEQVKEARADKKKNYHHDAGFSDLYGLTMIGYGGTKPQNISVLNTNYGGKAYLLMSVPPKLTKQNQRKLKTNFFTDVLRPMAFKKDFLSLHKIFKMDYNNINIRDHRDNIIQTVIDQVIERMWSIRSQEIGWSADVKYFNLAVYQKIWLDESRNEDRLIDEDWLDRITTECARWFISAYEKVLGSKAIYLGDKELLFIRSIIEMNKEDLR